MKNEYFQENLKKRIKITREMILSKIPNQIFERKKEKENPKVKEDFLGCYFL